MYYLSCLKRLREKLKTEKKICEFITIGKGDTMKETRESSFFENLNSIYPRAYDVPDTVF